MTAKELNEMITSKGGRLIGNRAAVAREATVTETKSGLIIPQMAQHENQYGAIVLIGDGPEIQAMNLNIGDRIYLQKFGGVDIKQRVGSDHYWLEVIHALDVYITYPDDGAPLQQGGEKPNK